MPDIAALMPLFAAVVLFAGAAIKSKSVMLAGGAIFMVLGYVSVRSGNTLMIGFFVLTAFFMTMGTGVYFTQTVMGDTA